MTYLLRELKPLTISRTKSGTGESYISLAHDFNSYTFFTTEETKEYKNGFVMTATTKEIHVEVLYEPLGNPETLLDCNYPKEYEELKMKALDWLFDKEEKKRKKNKRQIIEVILKLKEAKNKNPRISLSVDDEEQDEIIHEFENQHIAKQVIIAELKNLKPTDPELVTINSKSFKRDNRTIAQIKILRDFKCQICSTIIKKKDGTFYIEAAHIQPKYRKGPETPDNILLLCPNHHKEFDLGDLNISQHDKDKINFTLNGQEHKVSLKID